LSGGALKASEGARGAVVARIINSVFEKIIAIVGVSVYDHPLMEEIKKRKKTHIYTDRHIHAHAHKTHRRRHTHTHTYKHTHTHTNTHTQQAIALLQMSPHAQHGPLRQ
jgi:hypothetical protein